MGRLVKRTAAEALHQYVCMHPYWVKRVLIDEYSGEEVDEAIHQASDYTPDDVVVDFANDYVRGDVELLSGLIAEEVPGTALTDLVFDSADVYWYLTADHELSEEECTQLGEYILGQCSDGLGESLEQREVKTDDREDYDYEYEDEETGELLTERHDARWVSEVHMWEPSMDTPVVKKAG